VTKERTLQTFSKNKVKLYADDMHKQKTILNSARKISRHVSTWEKKNSWEYVIKTDLKEYDERE
jgi:hypothetical protein